MKRRTLYLHIDRLVVEGLPAHSRTRLVRALEAQLTELASHELKGTFERGQTRRIASLDGGLMRAGSTPEQAAGQITTALQRELTGETTGGGSHHA